MHRCASKDIRNIHYILRFILFCLILSLTVFVQAAETLIVNVVLNQEAKGEFFVQMTGDADFLIKTDDLKSMGFSEPAGKITQIAGESFLSLKSIQGVTFIFDEKTLALNITAKPDLLAAKSFDFASRKREKVYYPRDSGAFLNYGFEHNSGDSFEFQSFNATSEIGVRLRDLLFLSNFSYQNTKEQETFTRLMSSMTYDRRDTLQRFTAGDFYAVGGDLGSTLNLGGLSFSKVYTMDPYFVKRPTFNFTGLAALPSEADIYLDGTKIAAQKISPGKFSLNDINYYGGARFVEVVMKDSFGRETRYRLPYYFNDVLLSKGLHEYSYNIGFLRQQYGVESNDYGDLAFSAYHKYGVTDAFNVGFNAEGTRKTYLFSPLVALTLWRFGTLVLNYSVSHNDTVGDGNAGLVNYGFQGRMWNWRLLYKHYSRNYMTVGNEPAATVSSFTGLNNTILAAQEVPVTTVGNKYEFGAGIGFGTREFGSISLNYSEIKKYIDQDAREYMASYSRNITRNSVILASFKHVRNETISNQFFISFNYYFANNTTLSASYTQDKDQNIQRIDYTKNVPVGEGYGYRVTGERSQAGGTTSETLNPFFQYNGRYGIYTGEYRGTYTGSTKTDAMRLTAAGSIAYTGGTFGLSRPITDSFGVVQTGDVKGVGVTVNGAQIGKTDASGKVFVPSLNSYMDNQVAINQKDIPMDHTIGEITKYVSPPWRSGSHIRFDVVKFIGITGMLHVKENGATKPAEFFDVTIQVDGKEVVFPTGKGGEFYFENVKPGQYKASFTYKEKPCSFDLVIPKSDDVITDLGTVTCSVR
jgi:outer membrane usher protein